MLLPFIGGEKLTVHATGLVKKLAVSLSSLCCCIAKKTAIMTKLQLLHRALNERLMAAVEQIMEMVGGTVLEYEEETIRARKENEALRRRLRWMEGGNPADWPGRTTGRD